MRTRRIAIGCRRTGWASTVAIAPSGLAGAPDPVSAEFLTSLPDPGGTPAPDPGKTPSLEAPPAGWPPANDAAAPGWPPANDATAPGWTRAPGLPPANWTPAPLPSRIPGGGAKRIPTPSAPPPGEQDLTLADLTTGRRDLSWNQNPGWPGQVEIDWTSIARGHTPRHARRRLRAIPYPVFTWTGAGIITAVLMTVLITTISELIQ